MINFLNSATKPFPFSPLILNPSSFSRPARDAPQFGVAGNFLSRVCLSNFFA